MLNDRYDPILIGSYGDNQFANTSNCTEINKDCHYQFHIEDPVNDKGFSARYKGTKRRMRGNHI